MLHRMAETMQRKGLRLPDLERMTGIDQSSLSRYANCKQSPSVGRAVLVARALDVSVEFLASEGEPATALVGCGKGPDENSPAPTAARR